MQHIVLTGGPGAGKTTVLKILANKGFSVGADAARTIIQDRKRRGLTPRPEPAEFARQILRREQAAYGAIDVSPLFYERGLVDAVGGMLGCGELNVTAARQIIDAHPYQHVFIFPPWVQIYTTDAERDHTFDHAVGVYQSTQHIYQHFGYAPIEVPEDTPHNRAEFILDHI